MRPHIYLKRGRWTCASQRDGWQVWPYGKGDTPAGAYVDWLARRGTPPWADRPRSDTYTITIIGRRAWWLRAALAALKIWARVTRRMPSEALISSIARRALRISFRKQRGAR